MSRILKSLFVALCLSSMIHAAENCCCFDWNRLKGGSWCVQAAALYFKASHRNVTFATSNTVSPDRSIRTRDSYQLYHTFHWGYRIGVTYNTCDEKLYARLYWESLAVVDSAKAQFPPNGGFITGVAATRMASARFRQRVFYDVVEFALGFREVGAFAGFRYFWIVQKNSTHAIDEAGRPSRTETRFLLDAATLPVGYLIELSTKCGLGLRLQGSGFGGLAWTRVFQHEVIPAEIPVTTIVLPERSVVGIVGGTVVVGVNYTKKCGRLTLSGEAGWQMDEYAVLVSADPFFAFQGLYLQLKACF